MICLVFVSDLAFFEVKSAISITPASKMLLLKTHGMALEWAAQADDAVTVHERVQEMSRCCAERRG